MTNPYPAALDEVIDYRFPDALWVEVTMHSEEAGSIWILDLDYTYTRWLASLSLDGRWTLSPREGFKYDAEIHRP